MDLNGDGLVSMEEFLQVTLQDDSYCQSISAFSNVLIWFFLENYYYHEIILQFYMCAWYTRMLGTLWFIPRETSWFLRKKKKDINTVDF